MEIKIAMPCRISYNETHGTIMKKIDRNQIDQVIMEEAGSILEERRSGGSFRQRQSTDWGQMRLMRRQRKKTYAAKGRPVRQPAYRPYCETGGVLGCDR